MIHCRFPFRRVEQTFISVNYLKSFSQLDNPEKLLCFHSTPNLADLSPSVSIHPKNISTGLHLLTGLLPDMKEEDLLLQTESMWRVPSAPVRITSLWYRESTRLNCNTTMDRKEETWTGKLGGEKEKVEEGKRKKKEIEKRKNKRLYIQCVFPNIFHPLNLYNETEMSISK